MGPGSGEGFLMVAWDGMGGEVCLVCGGAGDGLIQRRVFDALPLLLLGMFCSLCICLCFVCL